MSYCTSDTKPILKKTVSGLVTDQMTQLRLVRESSGKLSLGDKKAVHPLRRVANRAAIAKKLQFEGDSGDTGATTSLKLARSKVISKKPLTKFQEFQLSHSKTNKRRTLLEDLFKSSSKE